MVEQSIIGRNAINFGLSNPNWGRLFEQSAGVVSLNRNGIFEVKFPNQPVRAFTTEQNAFEYFNNNYQVSNIDKSQAELKKRIESLRTKRNRLQKWLNEDRKKLTKKQILKFEQSLKESQSELLSRQMKYDKLSVKKDKIVREQNLPPLSRKSLKNARLAEANAKFQGTTALRLDKNLGLNGLKAPLSSIERTDYESFWKQELDKLDSAKPKPSAANVFPSADGKTYENMLKGNSLVDRLGAKPFANLAQDAAETKPKIKTSFLKRIGNGIKGKKTLAGITAAAITAFVGYNVSNAQQARKIDALLARKA